MPVISDSVLAQSGESLRLIGGREKSTGKYAFPLPEGGERARYDRIELNPKGTLWSYTIQRFPPKNPPYLGVTDPAAFKPFAVGYVELEGEVIVEARLVTDDFGALKLGLPMELTSVEFDSGAGGEPYKTYAFKPA
ncbi:MAG: OB-fold domain-containing protein [Pseudomonadota bacterium]